MTWTVTSLLVVISCVHIFLMGWKGRNYRIIPSLVKWIPTPSVLLASLFDIVMAGLRTECFIVEDPGWWISSIFGIQHFYYDFYILIRRKAWSTLFQPMPSREFPTHTLFTSSRIGRLRSSDFLVVKLLNNIVEILHHVAPCSLPWQPPDMFS